MIGRAFTLALLLVAFPVPAEEPPSPDALAAPPGVPLALLLTLLATPVAYSLFDDAQQAIGRAFRRLRKQPGAEAAKGPALARAAAEM